METNHKRIIEKHVSESHTVIQSNTNTPSNEEFGALQGKLNSALNLEARNKQEIARLTTENTELNRKLDQQYSNQSYESQLNQAMREKSLAEERLKFSTIEI